jgi:4-amino-4-deoxy-L-arabinose transferase-like glycosyltransferase
LLYVAGLWAICVPRRRRAWSSVAGGVLLAAAVLTKPGLRYLIVFLLPALAAANADSSWRERLRVPALVAAGFLAGLVPHLVLSNLRWQTDVDRNARQRPDSGSGIVFANAGWKSDHVAFGESVARCAARRAGKRPQRRRPAPTIRPRSFAPGCITCWSSAVTLQCLRRPAPTL